MSITRYRIFCSVVDIGLLVSSVLFLQFGNFLMFIILVSFGVILFITLCVSSLVHGGSGEVKPHHMRMIQEVKVPKLSKYNQLPRKNVMETFL
jgi:hypothetical protein